MIKFKSELLTSHEIFKVSQRLDQIIYSDDTIDIINLEEVNYYDEILTRSIKLARIKDSGLKLIK